MTENKIGGETVQVFQSQTQKPIFGGFPSLAGRNSKLTVTQVI